MPLFLSAWISPSKQMAQISSNTLNEYGSSYIIHKMKKQHEKCQNTPKMSFSMKGNRTMHAVFNCVNPVLSDMN